MTLSPEILRRIADLPKAVIADVLSLIADLFAANAVTSNASNVPQIEPQKPQNEAFAAKFAAVCEVSPHTPLPRILTNNSDSLRVEESTGISTGSLELPSSNSSNLSTKKPRTRDAYTAAFQAFWEIYPRKINKKEAARKHEKELKRGVPQEIIINAVKVFAAANSQTEKQFIKAPDVWLHKGCYDDELPMPRGNGQLMVAGSKWEQRADGWWRDGAPVNKDGSPRAGVGE